MIVTARAARLAWSAMRRAIVRKTLAPPEKKTISEWADSYRRLSRDSAEPGQWRTSRVPFLRPIMDAMCDPDVEEVVFVKSAQIGYTDGVMGNSIAYYIDHEPASIMVVQPTVDDAEKWSKDKLQPMLEETPRLANKVGGGGRDSSNTILAKRFPGGRLRAVGTNSPRALRSTSARVVLFDEVDAYPPSSGDEGDAVSLGKKRALTFGNRKYLLGSTPTIKGVSRIDKAYEASSQGRWYVPCPHCGTFQTIEWRNIRWDTLELEDGTREARPETAYLVCDSEKQNGCGAIIEERHKVSMVQAGEDRHRYPERGVLGFHINAFYSLFAGARWEFLVREFLEARGDREKLMVWTNTVLGESFEEDGERVAAGGLAERLELAPVREGTGGDTDIPPEYLIPEGVAVLTCAIDVQGDRLEYSIRGWGPGRENWLIDTEAIPGDPGTEAPWRKASHIITRPYHHVNGSTMRIAVTFVDSGGHHSEQVYAFTKLHRRYNVFAIKGSSIASSPVLGKPGRSSVGKVILYMVGGHAAKDALMSLLKVRTPGPGFVHLPDWLDMEQLEQLTAEKVITRYQAGRPIRVWVKVRDRNEQLDLFVYELAAFAWLRMTDDLLRAELAAVAARAKAPEAAAPSVANAPARGSGPPRKGFVTGWK